MPAHHGLTLLESSRHYLMRQLSQITLGTVAEVLLIVGAVGVANLPDDSPDQDPEKRPFFLAPKDQRPARAAQEQLHFVGIAGAPVPPSAVSSKVPTKQISEAAPMVENPAALSSPAQTPSDPQRALSEIEVDSLVETDPMSEGPAYPPELLAKQVEGVVLAQFVVDTTGRVTLESFKVAQSTDSAFTAAVRAALPRMKFKPAWLRGRVVPQLVEQSFAFRVTKPALGNPAPGRGPR